MNSAPVNAPPVINPALSQARTLRRLFLMLFLRGRSSRGIRVQTAPKSIWRKLGLALLIYTCFGASAVRFFSTPIFGLAIYLHGMTFLFLGMFVSSSAGEILFNKEEADILLHRPVTARELLWSKIRVLIEVSLMLAGALNLAGFFVGARASDSDFRFPLIHLVSMTLEALFCTGCIVLAYQLCLRWFGRERLEGLMTTVQVFIAVAVVAASQIFPRLMFEMSGRGALRYGPDTWWIALFPPGWFAGLDNAVAGTSTRGSWILAAIGLAATGTVLWLAFGKLAHSYEKGLQVISETVSRKRAPAQRRWTEILGSWPPVKWFSPVSRASFLLTAAYLFRDRDVKLRVFPGIAPMLMMPLVFLFQGSQAFEGFGIAFSAGFFATTPLVVIDLLQFSQQWQASDIFRVAPMAGPAELCHGARRAVLCLLVIPAFIVIGFIVWVAQRNASHLLLFLPGILLLPIVSLVPAALNRGVPLCVPNEEAKSAGRSVKMMVVMILAVVLSGIASSAFAAGWFGWMLLAEFLIAVPIYLGLRARVSRLRWPSME
jgi:ABC-2 type transport system permease protein